MSCLLITSSYASKEPQSVKPPKTAPASFPAPIEEIAQDTLLSPADAFLAYLQEKGIVDATGRLLIKAPIALPPLNEEENVAFEALRNTLIEIRYVPTEEVPSTPAKITKSLFMSGERSVCLQRGPQDKKWTIYCIVGSRLWETLPMTYLTRCLEQIGVDPEKVRLAALQVLGDYPLRDSADIDTKMVCPAPLIKETLLAMGNCYISGLATKCGLTFDQVKSGCLDKLSSPGMLIVGAGRVDTTIGHKGQRLFVTTTGSLGRSLSDPKIAPTGPDPYQAIIDFLCQVSRVPKPTELNGFAYARLLIDQTRSGHLSASEEDRSIVKTCHLESENPIGTLINAFNDHLPFDALNLSCFLLNELWSCQEEEVRNVFDAFQAIPISLSSGLSRKGAHKRFSLQVGSSSV